MECAGDARERYHSSDGRGRRFNRLATWLAIGPVAAGVVIPRPAARRARGEPVGVSTAAGPTHSRLSARPVSRGMAQSSCWLWVSALAEFVERHVEIVDLAAQRVETDGGGGHGYLDPDGPSPVVSPDPGCSVSDQAIPGVRWARGVERRRPYRGGVPAGACVSTTMAGNVIDQGVETTVGVLDKLLNMGDGRKLKNCARLPIRWQRVLAGLFTTFLGLVPQTLQDIGVQPLKSVPRRWSVCRVRKPRRSGRLCAHAGRP